MLPMTLLKYLTIAVLFWEGYGPIFWFFPYSLVTMAIHIQSNIFFSLGPLKTLTTLAFVVRYPFFSTKKLKNTYLQGMHVGFFGCLRLGMFGPCCMSALTVFFPPYFWDRWVIPLFRYNLRIFILF
jgi:hypothetical protein